MSLLLTLNNAISGLNVSKQSLAVLSQNIANVNTPDYSRKVLGQSPRVIDGQGAGVKIEDITRKTDEYLARTLQRQNSVFAKADILNSFADRMQILLGKPGSGDSISTGVTGFFNVLQMLADSPDHTSLRLNAVNAGVNVAHIISQLASSVEDLRFQADRETVTAIQNVNAYVKQLEDVNNAINLAFNSGQSTANLLDKRDTLLRQIGESVDISYFVDASGQAHVTTNTGFALLDGARFELVYNAQSSKDAFVSDTSLSPIQIYRVDAEGTRLGTPTELVSGGTSSEVTTAMVTGKIRGLLEMRDEKLPGVLEQLDTLAAQLRDQVNATHNSGIPYPGANSFTGTRLVNAAEYWEWQGEVRIALLKDDGRPIPSVYSDETSGFRPLTIDLSTLDTSQGSGKPSVQGIIDEINAHFYMPQNKAKLGDINNIRMVSGTTNLSSTSPSFTFDFDLENIAAEEADFWVTGVTVLDAGAVDITSTTNTIPNVNLAATNTYVTTNGSTTVTINTAAAHGLSNGDVVYLSNPGVPVNGIPAANVSGFFTISNVGATSFQITAGSAATSTGGVNVASQTAKPKYASVEAGELIRTSGNGTITASFSANPTSSFYTIKVDMGVRNNDGTIKQGQIQYQVMNPASNIYNERYGAQAVTGQAVLTTPSANAPLLKAMLVDADGDELPIVNGKYTENESGYLKIVAMDSNRVVAIDSLDSKQLGFPNNSPAEEGTDRNFSHYFELNNFFKSNSPTTTGDTLKNSAYYLAVEDRLRSNSNLISLGRLSQSAPPANSDLAPYYTYERNPSDNSAIQDLAGLTTGRFSFAAAGGLGEVTTDFTGYAGEILGFSATDATELKNDRESAKLVLDGFNERFQSISGVNLDEELANTIIYQNAYTASARLITVTNQLFETLLNSVGG